MDFGDVLRRARDAAGMTQADVASTTGIARPNIAAYESGRREPRTSTAARLLAAVGYHLIPTPTITWTWTESRRPYPVPSCLWRLPTAQAFATISTAPHIWWSGPQRHFDLTDRDQRRRAYEIFLREGNPEDIEATVDGALLIGLFDELVLPAPLRDAWRDLIDRELRPRDDSAAA